MRTEIDSAEALRLHLEQHAGLANTVVQGLDLREQTAAILSTPATGAVLLGCQVSDEAAAHVLASGGTVFPRLDHLPYHPFRPTLYHVDELMSGYRRGEPESFARTTDQRIYAHYDALRRAGPMPVLDALAQRLHDHAIDDALEDLLQAPHSVVAIMGGHAMARDEPAYQQIARVAQRLQQRDPEVLLASGGGPGAMEATHLGAWLGRGDDAALSTAIATLSPTPSYRDPGWLDTAYEVRETSRSHPNDSLAIPTWFYGHEPTNLFATHIAKYFSNSLREDGLLAIATRGVIYAPGSAGTVQEIFMDAAQNHYGTFGVVSPMVFLGTRYWTEDKPVLPLLRALAGERQYAAQIHVTDDVDDVVGFILEHPPLPYAG